MKLRGEWNSRSGGDFSSGLKNRDRDNADGGNIGDDVKDGYDRGGGRRGSGNCNENVGSAESGKRRGRNGSIMITADIE